RLFLISNASESLTLRLLLTIIFHNASSTDMAGTALLGDLETHSLDCRPCKFRFLQPWAQQGLTPKEWQDLEGLIYRYLSGFIHLMNELEPLLPPPAGTPTPVLLVCRVTGFYPRPVRVAWLQDGEEVVLGWWLNSSEILPNADLTYQLRSSLAVEPGAGHSYACRVQHSSLGGQSLASESGATPEPAGAPLALWSPLRGWAWLRSPSPPWGREQGRDKGKEKLG
uniref:Ig-like domain-containing protein n=1 Tax=Chelonoidis abingdonii TaxID=106734 RepID=A0A8C0G5U1_CHEAB